MRSTLQSTSRSKLEGAIGRERKLSESIVVVV
jgi:hypothetical protein